MFRPAPPPVGLRLAPDVFNDEFRPLDAPFDRTAVARVLPQKEVISRTLASLLLAARVTPGWAQEVRFLRIAGPVPTVIPGVAADGAITRTNATASEAVNK